MKFQIRLAAFAFVFAIAAVLKAGILDWSLRDRRPGNPTSDQYLSLHNLTAKQYLRYGRRNFGINLEWDKNAQVNVQIIHRGAKGQPLLYTEDVSIFIKGGGYLKYEKRNVGINLGWSSTPVYQWQIGGDGGDPGAPIRSGDKLCLYNKVAKDFLIYDSRKFGINLIWSKDLGTKSWGALMRDVGNALGYPSTKMSNWVSGLGK